MKLIAATCCNCNQVIGYLTPQALQIPTLCVECAANPEVMKEWGHQIDRKEKMPNDVLISLRHRLNRMGVGL